MFEIDFLRLGFSYEELESMMLILLIAVGMAGILLLLYFMEKKKFPTSFPKHHKGSNTSAQLNTPVSHASAKLVQDIRIRVPSAININIPTNTPKTNSISSTSIPISTRFPNRLPIASLSKHIDDVSKEHIKQYNDFTPLLLNDGIGTGVHCVVQ